MEKGVEVLSRNGSLVGLTTGAERRCQMDGCRGSRIVVRWADKSITYPCSKGMVSLGKKWKIL